VGEGDQTRGHQAGVTRPVGINASLYGLLGLLLFRAKIDCVCGPSKQIIVIQKQDCVGLALVQLSRTRVVSGPTKNFGDFVENPWEVGGTTP
jgi:hypothetical protein